MILVATLTDPDAPLSLPALPITRELRVVATISLKDDYAAKLTAAAPDVVLADLRSILESSGIVLAKVRRSVPDAAVLVIGDPDTMSSGIGAVVGCRRGYLARDISCGSLLVAIQSLVNGSVLLSQVGWRDVGCPQDDN